MIKLIKQKIVTLQKEIKEVKESFNELSIDK
jgi:hypothetical protein